MSRAFLYRCLEPLLGLVLPERCRLCNSYLPQHFPKGICSSCLSRIVYMGVAVCRKCGGLLRSGSAAGFLCGSCIRRPPPWDHARSVVRYGPEVRRLLLRLKYQADTTVLPALSTIVHPELTTFDHSWDYILPVPLHRTRLQRRGMNQALSLARILFPREEKRIAPHLLQRKRATSPQTGLDGADRRRNLRGAFEIAESGALVGARVVIVDDVFTTGSTMIECARVARRAGAAEIGVITLARVVMGQ